MLRACSDVHVVWTCFHLMNLSFFGIPRCSEWVLLRLYFIPGAFLSFYSLFLSCIFFLQILSWIFFHIGSPANCLTTACNISSPLPNSIDCRQYTKYFILTLFDRMYMGHSTKGEEFLSLA